MKVKTKYGLRNTPYALFWFFNKDFHFNLSRFAKADLRLCVITPPRKK